MYGPFSASVLEVTDGQLYAPVILPQRKGPAPDIKVADWAPRLVWEGVGNTKFFVRWGFEPRTFVKLVA